MCAYPPEGNVDGNSHFRSVRKTRLSGMAVCLGLFYLCCLFPGSISSAAVVSPTAQPRISDPRLNVILPRGVQRGGNYTLRFSGARLKGAAEIFLYDQGITVTGIKEVDANNLDVSITVSPECRLGEHVAQVRTRSGISDYRSFFIGAMPELSEKEPNSEFSTAQQIPFQHTVNGVILPEDQDYFRFTVQKGQRINVEVEAVRLGAMFDPFISLLDKNRFELAVSDDSALGKQDGMLSVVAPEDGEYTVLIRESSFGGNGNCRYRLHIGSFPRPKVAYPAGGPAGSEVNVRFIGDATGDFEQKIKVADKPGFRPGLFVADEKGTSPTPVLFRVSDVPNVMEGAEDKTWASPPAVPVPAAFNGIIEKPADRDFFKFSGKKGQVVEVECFGRRIGSGIDSVVNVFRADNKQQLAEDDDTRRPDSYVRVTLPVDGEYFVRVRDHRDRGQPDFVYRVEVKYPKASVNFSIPRVDRYSQRRQTIFVARGNRFATRFQGNRANFGGELKLFGEGLPPGVRMVAPPMKSNLNLMPVVFEAAEDAELGGALIDFRGGHVDDSKNITGGFFNLADFALGQPNNARYYGCVVDKLPIAVVDKLPFKLEIVQPKVPLVRDGSINLKIVATRDPGFDQQINVQFPFRPPGIGTNYQLAIPKGKTELNYPLNANGGAQLGKWPVYAIGAANVQGLAWASTQMAELEIAEPLVKMSIKRAVCVRGEVGKLVCQLQQLRAFEGEATAEILGLPPHVTTAPQRFTKETKELTFDLTTTDKTPFGKHRSLFCRVTIMQNGEPIVSTAARTELQVTKPKPPKPDPKKNKAVPGKQVKK